MDPLSMARELIGHTLAFHIIIVAFSRPPRIRLRAVHDYV